MFNSILIFSFISGICGLAYEVLYSRLLSTYFGNIFYVSAAILISFLLSIGIGSLVGRKFVRFIGLIEIGIGIYGICAVYFFNNYALNLLQHLAIHNAAFPYIFSTLVALFLIIPAFLIGFSVPIFSLYLKKEEGNENSFVYVYALYNIGAAICVLVIEYFLVRTFGLSVSILTITTINIVNGIFLLFKVPLSTNISKTTESKYISKEKWVALFLVSVASGIFQLFLLKVCNSIFGPLNENFAIILFVVLFGITIATVLSYTSKISYKRYLALGSVTVVLSFCLLTPFIYFWATLQEHIGIVYNLTWILKPIAIFIFGMTALTFFGGTIPFLLQISRGHSEQPPVGKALAISSFGNVVGYLLMTFVLYEAISDSLIPFIIILLIMLSIIFIEKRKKEDLYFIVFIFVLSILVVVFWPQKLLSSGYGNLNSLGSLITTNNELISWEEYKKFNSFVSILHFKDGSRWLSINGSINLRFNADKRSQLREMVVGLSPGIYSKNHNNALVLGLGSGITAGTVAKIFKKTTVVEINPAMLQGAASFSEENMQVLKNPNVTIAIQDGIIELLNTSEKYDAIVNTVTGPKYFSSSKLWTKEIFDAISSKLNSGGVYSMWFDLNIGTEGIQVMAKTAESSFLECRYVYLNAGYLNVICSNDTFTKKNIPDSYWPQDIIDRFKEYKIPYSVNDFINHLTLKIENRYLFNMDTKINTLDFPILEFIRPKESNTDLRERFAFINNILNLGMVNSPFEKRLLSKEERHNKCFSILVIENSINKSECQ